MIELRRITKSYPTPHGRRYVFRDLSFSFPEDVSIGLIGPNGAGKSTLMRLLGGIDAPDHGSVESDVNISWPVGLSGGMQTALSGRDNARFVCRLYGATGREMREKLRYIEEFSEIGEYFDLPVRSYSSGMRSRLAFGMSMAFDFDYYLIDELMAVGDAQFRRKSQQVFQTRLATANLILVSHNMADIRQWCDVVVLVKDGTATLYEDVEAGIVAYQGPTAPAVPRARRPAPARRPEPAAAAPAPRPAAASADAPAAATQPSTVA
jgi:capsular polysaccharide transport system ATP-binding protein